MQPDDVLCFGVRQGAPAAGAAGVTSTAGAAGPLRFRWAESEAELLGAVAGRRARAVALSHGRSRLSLEVAERVIAVAGGELPVLLIVDAKATRDRAFLSLLDGGNRRVDYALRGTGVPEIIHRLRVLLRQPRPLPESWEPPRPAAPARLPAHLGGLAEITRELHDVDSQRLNARPVAELFGVPLARLAKALGASPAAVHKTPDAPGLQRALGTWERVARALALVNGDGAGLRRWLHSPNPELENHRPLDFMLDGRGETVADLVEDALLGQPA